MFNIFRNKKNNEIINTKDPKIKWDEIENETKKYLQIDKETFEEQNILSQQLFIQIAIIKKEKEVQKNIENNNIPEENKLEYRDIILLKDDSINNIESFNKWLDKLELYAKTNIYNFNLIYNNLKKEKNKIYNRTKTLENNINNNYKNDVNDKKLLKIKKYKKELNYKIEDLRIKRILYFILSEIKKSINKKNKNVNLLI